MSTRIFIKIGIQQMAVTDSKIKRYLVPPFGIKINLSSNSAIRSIEIFFIGNKILHTGIIIKNITTYSEHISNIAKAGIRVKKQEMIIDTPFFHSVKIGGSVTTRKWKSAGKTNLFQTVFLHVSAIDHETVIIP